MTDQEKKNIEKAEHKQRLAIKGVCNRLLSQFSFQNIKTWNDVYRFSGYDDTYIKANFSAELCATTVKLQDVKDWCKKLQDDFEKQLAEKHKVLVESSVSVAPVVKLPTTPVVAPAQTPPVFQPASITSKQEVPDESGFNNSNDYGLWPSAKEKAFLFWFQKKATREALDKIIKENKPAVLVLASTGTGKTYIKGAIERRLADVAFLEDQTWGHSKSIDITKATVVEQDKRVFRNHFTIDPVVDCEVINIEQLRARAGQIWIQNKPIIVNGEEQDNWEWKPLINPVRFHLDECQGVKNDSSIQHKIACAFSAIPTPTVQIYYSATPFTRVSEAKAFAIATKKDISKLIGIPGSKLSAITWPTYAAAIAAPSDPTEYNEAAVERLMKDLDDYVVRVKNVRWQFNAINKVEIIDFQSPESRAEYDAAWNRYLIKKAKLEESVTDNPRFQALIELGIFLAAAEYCKRDIFAERMYRDVQAGKASVLAVKFKKTLIAVVKILHEKYGVSRDNISLVWGGGQTQLTDKQKLKAQVSQNMEAFEAAGISMDDLMLSEVEDRVLEDLPPELRLGIQSKPERQREIDRFQSGRSLYCIYTYKAGGVGLSLHHTDEYTKYKVRRQKNGYAVVEDIPNVPTRPRRATVGPTWSPIELVQGAGRVPRLTSLSDTEQCFLYYRGTVEEEQAFVVTHRLKCLSKVVRQQESWMDLITNHTKAREIVKELLAKDIKPDDEGDLIGADDLDDDN